MKHFVVTMVIFIAFCYSGYCVEPFRDMQQIFNMVLDVDSMSLKNTPSHANIEFKKATLAPDTDSGTDLAFSHEVSAWTFRNLSTAEICWINFDNAATVETSFEVPASTSISMDADVTTIHAIASASCEVEVIGAY